MAGSSGFPRNPNKGFSNSPGTQVRWVHIPDTKDLPKTVKEVCDNMLVASFRLSGTFVYGDYLVLVFQ